MSDNGRWYAACQVIRGVKTGRLCERTSAPRASRVRSYLRPHDPDERRMLPNEELGLLKAAFISTTTSSPLLRPRAIQTLVDCARSVGRAMRGSGIPAEQAVIEVKRAAHAVGDTEKDAGLLDRAVTAVIQGFYESDHT